MKEALIDEMKKPTKHKNIREAALIPNFELNYELFKTSIDKHNRKKSLASLFKNKIMNSISFNSIPKERLHYKQR